MGTIPTIASFPSGGIVTSSYLNQIKTVNDFWANAPGVYVYSSAVQSITSGTANLIGFDLEVYDIVQSGDTPSHDNATNNSRLICRTAGKYEIGGQIQIASNATGTRAVQVRLNAAGNPASGTLLGTSQQAPLTGASTSVTLPPVRIALAIGDYIEMFATQTSGGALNTVIGQGTTFLRMDLVRS